MRYERYAVESRFRVASSYGNSVFSIVRLPFSATIASIDFRAAARRPSSIALNALMSGLDAQSGGGREGDGAAGEAAEDVAGEAAEDVAGEAAATKARRK